ncbi:hypothetical protein D6D02_09497 [Aureobasidium pullulans]|nr:hypothetical protein D6D02_09497 [Aureobasidium pullulans]
MPSPPDPKRAAISQYWHSTGFTGTIARATLRTLQFITSIILLGIYGSDLSYFPSSTDVNSPGRTNWIFAIVVAFFSAVTCILHCFLTVKRLGWIFWDLVLCVLYAALSGTFGSAYLGAVEDADRRVTQSVQAMRAGVAFALIGMGLWLVTWIQGISWCCSARRITRRTDREDEEEGVELGGVGKVSEDD